MDGATALYERLLEAFTYLQPWRAGASDCTYCRRPGNKGRVCYSTFTSRLACADYDGAFLERGFMRSGTSLYRPLNAVSCCPNLEVRLDALAFRPSRGQRAALRRVAELEGIIPALESSHAVAWVLDGEADAGTVDLICLSGRGDKDLAEVLPKLGLTG